MGGIRHEGYSGVASGFHVVVKGTVGVVGWEWVAGGLRDVQHGCERCRWAGLGTEGYSGVTSGSRVVVKGTVCVVGCEWVAGGLRDVQRGYGRRPWAGLGAEGYSGVASGFRVVVKGTGGLQMGYRWTEEFRMVMGRGSAGSA